MNWAIIRNNGVIKIKDIPILKIETLRSEIIKNSEKRVVSFFGYKNDKSIKIFAILAEDDNSRLFVSSSILQEGESYQSITPDIPAFHLFEREIYEEFGIKPEGHPWLKPVRYSFNRYDKSQTMKNYPFFKMEGEEIHEVAVGPIHAGIIEPGHFRFQCYGEKVYHLEIQLGYQHRGIEDMFIKINPRHAVHLAESIAGDSVIAHTLAYCNLIEGLSEKVISRRTKAIRGIALEMERIAIHIGDLSALAGDIAYLQGNSIFGALRTLVINTMLDICGSRFGRGFVRPGGVVFDINEDLKKKIKNILLKVMKEVSLAAEAFFSSSSVLSRLEQTGTVDVKTAKKIGMVGPAARASGVAVDVRADHPYGIYITHPVHKLTLRGGDVFSRAYMRYLEIKQSIRFILEILEDFPEDSIGNFLPLKLRPTSFSVSLVEGWRGEIAHIALTDEKGQLFRYKIKDPSFNNWYGLALAVKNNGISDFPLCNKSFNLSYCGYDL